ncbi:hypothetical protein CRUP_008809, partial [Coryphaenoides rupestris]
HHGEGGGAGHQRVHVRQQGHPQVHRPRDPRPHAHPVAVAVPGRLPTGLSVRCGVVRGQPRGVHRLESRRQQHQTQPHRWDQHRVRLRAKENQQFSEDPQGGGPRSVPMPGRQQTERVSLQRAHRGGAGGPGVQGGPAPLLEPGLVPTVQRHRRRPRLGGGEQQPVGAPVPLPAPAPAAPRPGRSVR